MSMMTASTARLRPRGPGVLHLVMPAICLCLTGCGTRGPDEFAVDLATEDGVRIVRNDSPLYEGEIVHFEKDLVLGGREDAPEWELFAAPSHLLIGPDGRLIIGDIRKEEIYLVSPEGALIKQLGGRGSGPGEFQNLWYFHWAEWGREFWVEDQHLNRVTCFSVDGGLLGTFNYARTRLRYNRFLDLGGRKWLGESKRETIEDSIVRFDLLEDQFLHARPFVELKGQEFLRIDRTGYPKPFRGVEYAYPVLGWDRIVVSRPEEGEITLYDTSGEPLFRIVKEWAPSPVSAADIAWWKANAGATGGRVLQDRMDFPPRRPLFSRVVPDNRGRLWVYRSRPPRRTRDEEAPPVIVDLFGPDGRWIGSCSPPLSLGYIWGDFAYDIPYLEDESPRVERWRIIPLEPEAAGSEPPPTPGPAR
jgi:hypothetical protein